MTDERGVQSIDRALDIIEVLAVEESGLGVTEIASRVGLHKSTAYRIIETLYNRGYLNKTQDNNYKIGLKLIEAVSCYINSLELETQARPYVAPVSYTHLDVYKRQTTASLYTRTALSQEYPQNGRTLR